MEKRNISVTLGEKLMTAFEKHKILKSVNKSAFIRDAVADYIEKNLKEKDESQNEQGEK